MNEPRGTLFVLSGPSGVGKGTVFRYLVSHHQADIVPSVSATTRDPRPGEVEGQHYYFVSREQFQEMIERDELLEYAEYVGNYYGTPRAPVERLLDEGRCVLLEIDLQGGLQIRQKCPDAVLIFLSPPSIEELSRRLTSRGTETEQSIRSRLEMTEWEMLQAEYYHHIIINDTVEEAAGRLYELICSERRQSRGTTLPSKS